MASGRPWGPEGTGSMKLSADVKPFVPKFAGLNVTWTESSEACVFPSCASTYYPFVQEPPVTEQKIYTEDTAFRASAFPPQYLSSEVTLHSYAYPPYAFESTQDVCSVPASRHGYSQPSHHRSFQTVKPQNEHVCVVPQERKAPLKKKTCNEKRIYNEQKFKRTEAPSPSEIKPDRGPYHVSIHAENRLKPGKNNRLCGEYHPCQHHCHLCGLVDRDCCRELGLEPSTAEGIQLPIGLCKPFLSQAEEHSVVMCIVG